MKLSQQTPHCTYFTVDGLFFTLLNLHFVYSRVHSLFLSFLIEHASILFALCTVLMLNGALF